MSFVYRPYSKKYPLLFEKLKENILSLSRNKLEIEHVGSTSVPGLGGKGIIDVQIGIRRWAEAKEIIEILKKVGFKHFHEIENHNLFVSNKDVSEEGDFHIHICRKGTKRYKRTLFFRNYLRTHPDEAKKYQEVKRKLFSEVNGDRKLFKKLKNDYFVDFYSKSDCMASHSDTKQKII